MKYMVMECHPAYAVVLDETGRFSKVANMHYSVGQTVTEVVEMAAPQTKRADTKKKTVRWVSSLAAVAACLVLIFTSVFLTGQMPYASIYMTINPEVRIDVNRSDIVVGLAGVNEDGKMLIEGYSYQKKDLNLVVDELVDRAIEMGFLSEGGQITLELDADDNQWVVAHSDSLDTQLSEYLTDKLTVTIEVTDKNSNKTSIPVEGGSGYGESDYGEPPSTGTTTPPSTSGSNYDDSGYEATEGDTDYGNSDYSETTPPATPPTSDSDYDDPDEDDSGYGDDDQDSAYG